MASHTASGEWKSFEIRMRRRRAERLVLRANTDIEAGSFEDALATLEEARALWPAAPGLRTLEERIANGRVPAVSEIHPPRFKEFAAAVAIVLFTGATVVVVVTKRGVLLTEGRGFLTRGGQVLTAGGNVLPARAAGAVLLPARDASAIVEPPPIVARAPITLHEETQSVEPEPVESDEPVQPTAPVEPPSPPSRVTPSKAEAPRPNVSVALPDVGVSRLPLVTTLPGATGSDVTPAAAVGSSSPPPEPATLSSPPAARATVAGNELVPPQEPPVRSVLARYAAAYSDLDVDAVRRVWPSVNRAALARAFANLDSQRVSLGDCRIQVDNDAARARCSGSATWTPRVGNGTRTDRRTWDFDLEKSAVGWQIVNARVQNR